ncbi:PRD domain-containing protein [Enterobacter intestinihominis]
MNDVGEQAVQTEQLANTMLQQVYALLARHNIIPNAVQEQMLTSHVRAMAHRSVTGEPLPEVEAELFDEISPDSMQLAREVVAQFGNLPDEEAWLLSVHFEVAKVKWSTKTGHGFRVFPVSVFRFVWG